MTEKVLIVDDEEDILLALKTFYEAHSVDVTTVSSGRECLKVLEQGFTGVVLIDIMMPKMNGWKTLEEIVRRQLIDNVKVKMITGKGSKDHSKIMELAPYIDDYIGKPFSNETLLSAVE